MFFICNAFKVGGESMVDIGVALFASMLHLLKRIVMMLQRSYSQQYHSQMS